MDAQQPESETKRKLVGKGVRQTEFTPEKGNALQACIATVLGRDLDDVPNFIAQEGDLYDSLRGYLSKSGMGFMKINVNEHGCLPFAPGAEPIICLLAGQSPRGSHKHVVVAQIPAGETKPEPLFDPHPSDDFLQSFIWVGLFVALQPKALWDTDACPNKATIE